VVGAQNIDIFGQPDLPLTRGDSIPGRIRVSQGGVGRNIAHNLALMGEDVKLITALGEDDNAALLVDACNRAGIDITNSLVVPDGNTSTYMFITNEGGDMELAVSDMGIYDHLTPQFLESKLNLINCASLCVVDTNLKQETLTFLAENLKVPIFADTVSTSKAKKLIGLLDKVHTIKSNLIEAELITGIKIGDEESLIRSAEEFLKMGVQRVFISLGSEGLYATDGTSSIKLPCLPTKIVNTTGAGDSLMAALAWSYCRNMTLEYTAQAGLVAASICVGSSETVSGDMCRLTERMSKETSQK